jgi:hypothetical protein
VNQIVEGKIDAWTDEAQTGVNHSGGQALQIAAGTGVRRYAWIYMKPPFAIGSDVNVTAATLRVWVRGTTNWTGTHTIFADRITTPWSEAGVTWAANPTVTGTNEALIAVTSPAANGVVELDVTGIMADVAAGGDFYGFRISVSSATSKALHSTETTTTALFGDRDRIVTPELEVTWNRAPTQPTDLRPAGGRAVASGSPLFRWNYHSALGEKSQAAFQFQIGTSSTMATATTDVTVTSPLNEYAPSALGLAVGTTYYWWVRVQDESGRWSVWSDIARLVRVAKPTLTITSPPNGGTVDDLTPPVVWSFTGQDQFSLVLYQDDGLGGWDEIYRTGRKASSVQTWTLPAHLIHKAGVNYKVRVRVWDTVDREDDPSRDFVEGTSVFQYLRSGVPTAPTSLVAVTDPTGPGILLTWNRTSTPDYWSIAVDGDHVSPRIDGASLSTGGTSYAYRFYGADPGGVRSVVVEAVVQSGGHLQHSNPLTGSVSYYPVGVWIVHEPTMTEVVLLGTTPPDMTIGESATTYAPIGRRDAVKITDTVRGYEGTLSGIMGNYLGVTSHAWRNRLETIKGKAEKGDVRLLFLDYSFPVILGEASISPSPDLIDAFDVTIPFAQVGEYAFRSAIR